MLRIADLDRELIRTGEYKIEALIAMQKEEFRLENEREQAIINANNLKEEIETTKRIQEELDEMRRSINQRFKEIEREYRQKEKDAIRDVRQEFRIIQREILAQERQRHQEALQAEAARRDETIASMQEGFQDMQSRLISGYQNMLKDEGIVINANFQEELAELRRQYAEELRLSQEEVREDIYEVSLELGKVYHQFEKDLQEYVDLKKKIIKLQSNNPVARKVRRQQMHRARETQINE
jgi:hypothetical protein